MHVKICGMTRRKDVEATLASGADALGFVVGSHVSGRNLTLPEARRLMQKVPIFTTKVAVTASQDLKEIRRICSALKPDALQLHHHTPQTVRTIRKAHPEIKLILATHVQDESSIIDAKRNTHHSDAIIAETPSATGMGGTGRIHDWKLTAIIRQRIHPHQLILAGGLTPNNVQLAIRRVKPFAVDVSSGVEKTIGVKDPAKVRQFIINAKGEHYAKI